jgi:hypothetical protein
MKKLGRTISFLIVLSMFSSVCAESGMINNLERIDTDLAAGYDRYGRKSKASSGSNDGFSYFWRSLLVPGWGEYKLGFKKQAAVFFITDMFMIGTAAALNYYSGVRTDEYKDFAEMYAGVDRSGKSESYWIHISNYDNTQEFNEQRNIDRYFNERYTDEDDFWNWESGSRREKYDEIRVSAENADTWFYYTLGGVALNHFVSALNASGKASSVKTKISQSFDGGGNVKNKLTLTYDF